MVNSGTPIVGPALRFLLVAGITLGFLAMVGAPDWALGLVILALFYIGA